MEDICNFGDRYGNEKCIADIVAEMFQQTFEDILNRSIALTYNIARKPVQT